MKKIVSLLIVMLLSVLAVNAQTSESKRKPKPTTTQTAAPKPVQATTQNNRYSGEKRTFIAYGVSFTMVYVQGGTFTMGALSNDNEAYSSEYPAHSVKLSSFSIGETEVTQALWQAVMGSNPSYYTGNNQRPVEKVSWNDCQEFIRKLNSLTGKNFRLPTEAEWEYAARGGDKSRGYKYSGSNSIDNVAWYHDNSAINRTFQTHPVKQKQANELGIYDMSGNVLEWCQDLCGDYNSSSQTNPTGPSGESSCVFRGGCWCLSARCCRSSYRYCNDPDYRGNELGLRLILSE